MESATTSAARVLRRTSGELNCSFVAPLTVCRKTELIHDGHCAVLFLHSSAFRRPVPVRRPHFSRLGRVHMHAMDGWRTKRTARSPPPAPVRKVKRPTGRPKERALVLDDPDDWVVREAPAPTKLS
eukprot:1979136-Prymnesium_polylepis.1